MKFTLIALALLTTLNANAGSLEFVLCKRELIAGALAQRAQDSTLEGLLFSSYQVTSFEPAQDLGSYPYLVTVENKNLVDGTVVTVSYAVKVINDKTCGVRAKLLAD
jgi:hypothetical protein